MSERYYELEYDEIYYIFDSDVIQKEEVDKEYFDDFVKSMSGSQVIDRLNEQEEKIKELQKENKQWMDWSKSIPDDLTGLIKLIPLEELSGSDYDFVVSQLDRLDSWNSLHVPYDELSGRDD